MQGSENNIQPWTLNWMRREVVTSKLYEQGKSNCIHGPSVPVRWKDDWNGILGGVSRQMGDGGQRKLHKAEILESCNYW